MRVWVLQEVALAPSATCQCGSLRIEWRDVHRAGAWAWHTLPTAELAILPDSATSVTGFMMTRTIDDLSRNSTSSSKTTDLWDLMACSAYLDVSDLRDHFYALLGLVRWKPEKGEYMQWLRVDYSLSTSAITRDAARAAIIQSESLSVLDEADGQYFSCESSSASDADLSSWKWFPRTPTSLTSLKSYSFCADRPLDLALVRDSAPHKCILLRGFTICEVSHLFPGNGMTKLTRNSQDAVKLGRSVDEITRELVGGDVNGIKLIRPFLEILTQKDPDPHLSGLNDEESLCWIQDFAKYLLRQNEAPCDSQGQSPSNSFKVTKRHEGYIKYLCESRRFFLTACGKIGMGPEVIEKGDCVAALFGGQYPCILRKHSLPEDERPHLDLEVEPKCYRFVGLAYIPRVMKGEAVEEKEAMGEAPAIFELW